MKRRLLVSLGAFLLLMPSGASGTSIGVPITYGGGAYLVGFEVESLEEQIGPETFRSIRYLGRVSMRVADPLIVSLRLGGSEIEVASDVHGRPTLFEGRPKLAIGLGAGFFQPLPKEGLGVFADAAALYTLSSGGTSFTTTIQSNTFHEEYENRYRWIEYQAGAGVRAGLPFGSAHVGVLGRAVDGAVWRETSQGGAEVSAGREDFSRAIALHALAGLEFRLPGRFSLSVGGNARSSDDFGWMVSVSEASR
ncbi:MAG: hypothetical protein ABIH26_00890 [Candidatus Eisenbacteria bacterium]